MCIYLQYEYGCVCVGVEKKEKEKELEEFNDKSCGRGIQTSEVKYWDCVDKVGAVFCNKHKYH